MNPRDWVILALVCLALGLGMYLIVEIRRLRKRLYKERLMDDIAAWATDFLLSTCTLDELFIARKRGEESRTADRTERWSAEIAVLGTRIQRIQETSAILGHHIHDHLADVNVFLDTYRGLVLQQLEDKISEGEVSPQFAKRNLGVRKLLYKFEGHGLRKGGKNENNGSRHHKISINYCGYAK